MKGIRFIPAFICIIISTVIFSGTAMADEPAYEARIGSTYYQTLEEAFSAAKYPDMFTITLLCDVTDITSTITVTGSCTLDMNGFDITGSCPVFHVTTGALTLIDLTDSGSRLTSTSGDCTVLSDYFFELWNVDVISETGAAIINNADYCKIYSGTASGKTYGIYCKDNFRFYGGTVTGGTAYYFSETNIPPSVYTGTKTVSEDGRTATVLGYENATAVYDRNLKDNSSGIICFDTLDGAINYCEGILDGYEVKLTLLHDVNLDNERQKYPIVIGPMYYGSWTIDMNGHNITGSGTFIDNFFSSNLTITNSSEKPSKIICGSDKVPVIINKGGLTLKNVTVSGGSCGISMVPEYHPEYLALTLNCGKITCEDGAGVNYEGGTVNLVSGTVSGSPYAFQGVDGLGWKDYTLGENSGFISNTDTMVTVGIKHTLAVTAGTDGSITTESGGDYVKGAEINLSASPDAGYYFSGWTSSGGGTFEDADSASTTFTMPDSAATVTAHFAQISNGNSDSEYYTISALAGTGGSISPSGSISVAAGASKKFTITPNDGYITSDVLVDGVPVGTVGAYTFENVKKAHIIKAVFEKTKSTVQWENPYADVTDKSWYYDAVRLVSEKGLMIGTSSNAFNPNRGMARGMFVTVLYRLSGDTGSYSGSFTDVPSGKWYENSVAWAANNGIAGGVGNNEFAPDAGITREQLAVLLYNYAKYKGYDVSVGEDTNILSYNDALNISDYAYPALQWACGAGIIDGDNNGYLNPHNSASRAEVAAMLQRFVENVVE